MAQILYFSTVWCGPCKMFKPTVQGVAAETGVSVQYIDAELMKESASQYNISSVPTIVVVDNGVVTYRHTGVLSKQQLVSLFKNFG